MKNRFPKYYSFSEKAWFYGLRIFCGLTLFFLMFPLIVIIPLSFNATPFFTFTREMLSFDPAGYSLQWYREFFTNPDWQEGLRNSVIIAISSTFLATSLGTLAALGLSRPLMPFRHLIMALLISPLIVPLIISAVGLFFFFSMVKLQGSLLGVIIAHTILGTPFVVLTVTATLSGFNTGLIRASASLGAGPVRTLFKVIIPLIAPGVISGALFAFITSFDEVVVVMFVGSTQQRTIPWMMFTGLREQISPTILSVATLMVILTVALLLTLAALRKWSERDRGATK